MAKNIWSKVRYVKDWFLIRSHQFIYLFWSWDLLGLILLVIFVYVVLALGVSQQDSKWDTAFSIMFDASVARSSLKRKLIYFFVWLIGGGVLVSALIKKYDKIADCDYRLWRYWFFRGIENINHVVVFGWNDSVVEFVRYWQKKTDCNAVVILTATAPEKIRTVLGDSCGVLLIYRCEYDDDRLRKKYLKLSSAKAIYVAGEDGSSLHDTRAILLSDKIKRERDMVPCFCDIHDFGLAQKMVRKCGPICYRNFHSAWGYAIARKMPKDSSVYIAGFGAMGKAVALAVKETLPKCHVFVSDEDDKFEQEWKRFEKEFSNEAQTVQKIDFGLFEEAVRDDSEKTVVIATRRSEKGWLRLSELIRSVSHKNNTYFLDQEIEGAVGQGECVSTKIGEQEITVFGMKRGAPWVGFTK